MQRGRFADIFRTSRQRLSATKMLRFDGRRVSRDSFRRPHTILLPALDGGFGERREDTKCFDFLVPSPMVEEKGTPGRTVCWNAGVTVRFLLQSSVAAFKVYGRSRDRELDSSPPCASGKM